MASTHPHLPVSTLLAQGVALEAPLSLPPPAAPEPVNSLQEAVPEPASSLQETAMVEAALAEATLAEAATVEAIPEPVSCLQEMVKERANYLQEVTASSLRERVHPLPFLVPAVCMEQVAVKDLTSHPLLAEVLSIQ